MKDKLKQFLDDSFKPYGNFPARKDVMQELLANLEEKYDDLTASGKSNKEAYDQTIESFGDVTEIMEQVAHDEPKQENDKYDLRKTIVDSIKGAISSGPDPRFRATSLIEADLANTKLSGSDFSMSVLMGANFDGSDLTKSKFKASALKGASFKAADLTKSVFDSSDIQDVVFKDANLTAAKFNRCALRGVNFQDATLDNTQFNQSDLGEVSFDGLTLSDTAFDGSSLKKTTFKNTILLNVSFHHSEVKHATFDGATMDKITHALLKGAKAQLDNVIIK